MPERVRVLIVGGGIAGLAAARALIAEGFDAEIVERAASWQVRGAGLYMPGNGVRALTALGLGREVLDRAVHLSHQQLLDHTGRPLAAIELARVWSRVGPCVGITRRELQRILRDGCATVPIRPGTTVTSLRAAEHDCDVTFSDGSRAAYDLVVGADGIHSSVRHMVFGPLQPRRLGQVSWRFLAADGRGTRAWTAMLGRRRAFLALPVEDHRVYCYADLVTPGTEDPIAGDPAGLRTIFKAFGEPARTILNAAGLEDIHFAPIEEVSLERTYHGRVVLIGDAAHATSPNMAEGASMALEDALILARTLARGGPIPAALAAFADRRRARVRWVQQRTHRRDRIRMLPAPLRNLALRLGGTAVYRRDYRPLLDEP
jgi:2-polyprenyl-6-methoxyphenol hydroxylase-like FAD-dependent oxidoreductase